MILPSNRAVFLSNKDPISKLSLYGSGLLLASFFDNSNYDMKEILACFSVYFGIFSLFSYFMLYP